MRLLCIRNVYKKECVYRKQVNILGQLEAMETWWVENETLQPYSINTQIYNIKYKVAWLDISQNAIHLSSCTTTYTIL